MLIYSDLKNKIKIRLKTFGSYFKMQYICRVNIKQIEMKTSESLEKIRKQLHRLISQQILKSAEGSLINDLELLDSELYKLYTSKKEQND